MIEVKVNGKVFSFEEAVTAEKLAEMCAEDMKDDIALAVINGKIQELGKKIEKDSTVSFLTMSSAAGHKAYVRTATMMLLRAIDRELPMLRPDQVKVEFAIGNGYYISIKEHKITPEELEKLDNSMRQLQEKAVVITKTTMNKQDAVKLFEESGMSDKVKLFKYRMSSYINVYELDGYKDYYYGYMLPDAGLVKYFELLTYKDGIILNLPSSIKPDEITEFVPREKLFATLDQANDWGNTLGIDTVGDLNDQICQGNISDLILVQEALQERRIGEIAKDIASRGGVKFVMIAGPSSSGKTTFSHRLSIQLRTLGFNPHPIALDDYFVDREHTPKDEHGNYNFECLEALDVKLFNEDMLKLLNGERVELPTFNFKTGYREYRGNFKQLGKDDILVLEAE